MVLFYLDFFSYWKNIVRKEEQKKVCFHHSPRLFNNTHDFNTITFHSLVSKLGCFLFTGNRTCLCFLWERRCDRDGGVFVVLVALTFEVVLVDVDVDAVVVSLLSLFDRRGGNGDVCHPKCKY